MKNYFEHFELPVTFNLDEGELRKKYLTKSREFHPDYYTLHEEGIQEDMLEQSSFNNKAYNILKDPFLRMKYILDLLGVIKDEGENSLPQEFLMEMMDINEEMMELSMDYSEDNKSAVLDKIHSIEKELQEEAKPALSRFNAEDPNMNDLQKIKDFYFKNRYLWRLKENLDKFVSH
jgi:molecular chaperone HscB